LLAGDSLNYHNGRQFTTKDRDNDARTWANCAQQWLGGWWYGECVVSDLNGPYRSQGPYVDSNEGVRWNAFRNKDYSLKKCLMRIRSN